MGKQVEGADLSPEMINFVRTRLNFPLHLCDAKKNNFRDNTFDWGQVKDA